MILVFHIAIAIIGIIIATLAFANSSHRSLLTSKIMAGLTLVSGVVLTIQTSASLLKTCSVGIAYFSVILYLNYKTNKNIAKL